MDLNMQKILEKQRKMCQTWTIFLFIFLKKNNGQFNRLGQTRLKNESFMTPLILLK